MTDTSESGKVKVRGEMKSALDRRVACNLRPTVTFTRRAGPGCRPTSVRLRRPRKACSEGAQSKAKPCKAGDEAQVA